MKVKIQTTLGDIVVRLYDETPIHRENFMKLVKEGYYDGTLFHRADLIIRWKRKSGTACSISVVPWLLQDKAMR